MSCVWLYIWPIRKGKYNSSLDRLLSGNAEFPFIYLFISTFQSLYDRDQKFTELHVGVQTDQIRIGSSSKTISVSVFFFFFWYGFGLDIRRIYMDTDQISDISKYIYKYFRNIIKLYNIWGKYKYFRNIIKLYKYFRKYIWIWIRIRYRIRYSDWIFDYIYDQFEKGNIILTV